MPVPAALAVRVTRVIVLVVLAVRVAVRVRVIMRVLVVVRMPDVRRLGQVRHGRQPPRVVRRHRWSTCPSSPRAALLEARLARRPPVIAAVLPTARPGGSAWAEATVAGIMRGADDVRARLRRVHEELRGVARRLRGVGRATGDESRGLVGALDRRRLGRRQVRVRMTFLRRAFDAVRVRMRVAAMTVAVL